MHEFGIASSIFETIKNEAKKQPGARIVAIGLRIGEVSGVEPNSLEFCLHALVKDTEFDPLDIKFERSPRHHRCPECSNEFDVVDYETACPDCGELRTHLVSGDEMEILYLEVQDT
jgi:hydrogenase nickel incorporation protein HypA/HybF